ncbi:helix-turn-helix transcriptional regulator [Butyrivibrio sp. VCB2001]|jgi:DNA-binding XRE family transcriptional regulator|uniref:helix-turn-helix transcriptional regulator n=1 Tax=Butyrivibrio sp. VCB2001 TaxID=1280667 RepID=UPI00047AA628|nr:helix-turn-helix transcriptional regulator [Butyrivibrio sp. VCB2001]
MNKNSFVDIELQNYSLEEFAKTFSNVVRETRQLFGMTQAELAELSGLNRSTIVKVEDPLQSGTTHMSTMLAIIKVLKINPNRIFYPEMTELNSPKQILMDYVSVCSEEELKFVKPLIEAYVEAKGQ